MVRFESKPINVVLMQIVGPALIIAMVSSLVFFCIEVVYRGPHTARLYWVMGLFTFAAVLVSRISIEEGKERAQLFGFALAVATLVASLQLVEFTYAGLSFVGPFVSLGLIIVVMWSAAKLTWDCTVVESSDDVSATGLVDLVKFGSRTAKSDDFDDEQGAPRQPLLSRLLKWFSGAQQSNIPGLWVFYFAVFAFPIFGLGQWFVRAESRSWVFVLFAFYLAATLCLLMTTSLLGLERYLAKRKLHVPAAVATNWMVVGGTFALLMLVTVLLIPKPTSASRIADWLAVLTTPQRQSSEFAVGNDGQKDEPDAQKKQRQQDAKRQAEGDKNQRSNKKQTAANAQQNSGQQGKGKSKQQSNGKQQKQKDSNRSQQKQRSNQNQNQRSSKNNQSSKNRRSEQNQSKKDKQSDRSESTQRQQNERDQKKQNQNGRDRASQQQRRQQKNDANAKRQQNEKQQQKGGNKKTEPRDRQTQNQPKAKSNNRQSNKSDATQSKSTQQNSPSFQEFGRWLSTAMKWLIYLVGLAAGIYLFWAFRDDLAKFWAGLFGNKEQPVNQRAVEKRPEKSLPPYASFKDPFRGGTANKMPTAQLLQYTLAALEAWAREHGVEKQPDVTLSELAIQIATVDAKVSKYTERFADVYGRSAFSLDDVGRQELTPLVKLWSYMDAAYASNRQTALPQTPATTV